MKSLKLERILCTAIHYQSQNSHTHQPKNISNGYVVGGLNYKHIANSVYDLTGFKVRQQDLRGFLTTHNRFVCGSEAAMIAYNANQIKRKKLSLEYFDLI